MASKGLAGQGRACFCTRGACDGQGADEKAEARAVDEVLRSTQSAHRLLMAFYQGQEKYAADEGRMGSRGGQPTDTEREAMLMNWYADEMPKRRTRPSLLQPLVQGLGFTAGAFAARVMPKEVNGQVSSALSEAFVEHLNDQIRDLNDLKDREAVADIKSKIVEIRDAERPDDEASSDDAPHFAAGGDDVFEQVHYQLLNSVQLSKTGMQMAYKFLIDQTKVL
eukprot:CAMPEP_0198246208 /NCGR_PEP_ID=MMETSP1446-20131203/45389_1 /TAXON_ID=1461542 ORGANISM="Unidentified sp, Strain CCMP2111" /NCGR_SAMPLE_ID=MMETSP1446 /ASSEMBLY_ACC=CAM_ASM_001112 /LENGTH=222 /DNA_ID=CAMNT_0043930509 /DNA_START=1 /DNA_END=669 /DNA_ORIENTATION=+